MIDWSFKVTKTGLDSKGISMLKHSVL